MSQVTSSSGIPGLTSAYIIYEGPDRASRPLFSSERGNPSTTMGIMIMYRASADRAFRHTLAQDVAKRPVRPRRRLFRR